MILTHPERRARLPPATSLDAESCGLYGLHALTWRWHAPL